jgi:UDP-N-acetylglucosamine 2-epimerase (non-hydrolysing)
MTIVASIVGARPNFVKIAPVVREAEKRRLDHRIINANQHADVEMNRSFFDSFELPRPDYSCTPSCGNQVERFAHLIAEIGKGLESIQPDIVLVYGDVATTAAGAIAARLKHLHLAHYGSGVRSGDRDMPEETNRRLVDSITDIHLAPHPSCVDNLERESVSANRIFEVGNLLADTLHTYETKFARSTDIAPPYALLTLHRPETVDDMERLRSVLGSVMSGCDGLNIVFPIHPRTRKKLNEAEIDASSMHTSGYVFESGPKDYFEMMGFLRKAEIVVTDSAGLREEALLMGRPCLTIREATEWPAGIEFNTNISCGYEVREIIASIRQLRSPELTPDPLPKMWDGQTAPRILDSILG